MKGFAKAVKEIDDSLILILSILWVLLVTAAFNIC